MEETSLAIIAASAAAVGAIINGGWGFLRFVINKVMPKNDFKEVDRQMLKSSCEQIAAIWKTDDTKIEALKQLLNHMKDYNERMIKQNEQLSTVLSTLVRKCPRLKENNSN